MRFGISAKGVLEIKFRAWELDKRGLICMVGVIGIVGKKRTLIEELKSGYLQFKFGFCGILI